MKANLVRQPSRPATCVSLSEPLDRATARAAARAWSNTVRAKWRAEQAALFAHTAMETLASIAAPKAKILAPCIELRGPLDEHASQLAKRVGEAATSLPLVSAMHFLASLYPAMLPAERRLELRAYYTPPALSSRLLELPTEAGLDWRTARVLDPATGGGALLVESACRMRKALRGSDPVFVLAQIANRLLGLEIDPYAAFLAQTCIDILLADLAAAAGREVPKIVRICDALEQAPNATFDLVVANPPYGRIALSASERRRFSRCLYGHANMYGVFTDIALQWAKPGAFVSYLTPTSMLSGQYYTALRRLLAAEAPPIAIDFVHARRDVFEDVLQETLLALYRVGASKTRVRVHYLHIDNENAGPAVTRNGTVAILGNPEAPWLAPRDPKHGSLIATVEGMSHRLADWGYAVSTGPLVWNRFKSQLRPKSSANARPLIWAEAVTSDGHFVFRAKKRGHTPYFELKKNNDWLVVNRACVLVQRTTAKEQERRLIAAELPERFLRKHNGVVIENHLNMVRPTRTAEVSPAAVAAILNSPVLDEVFRCMNGSVAVSAYELEALPLPSVHQMKAIEKMVAKQSPKADVNKAIARLYGWGGSA